MRLLLLFLLGLAIGAIGASTIGNSLRLRHAYTRGVMAVMQHHLAALQGATHADTCPATASAQHLRRIAAAASDIVPAFRTAAGADFGVHAGRLQHALVRALQTPPADCPALARTVQQVGDTCDACHRLYR